eukprot:2339013-Rhodomonas_salina.1
MSECKEQYETALALNPKSRETFLHYYTTLQEMVDWDSRDDMIEAVRFYALPPAKRCGLTELTWPR